MGWLVLADAIAGIDIDEVLAVVRLGWVGRWVGGWWVCGGFVGKVGGELLEGGVG